jgi:hypothetical protein
MERNLLKDLDLNGRKILKWVLKISGMRVWIGFMWLRIGSIVELLP